MRILFTGASSFTGYWFVKTLSSAGHNLVCPLTRKLEDYSGLRRRRLDQLQSHCKFIPEAPFGSEAFLKLAEEARWDLLCHHGAETANYRSPDFNLLEALGKNARNLSVVLNTFGDQGLRAVVLTGTVFEQDEGIGNAPMPAFSPYGLSKGLTFQVFRYYCAAAGIPLAKFVIPNAFGAYEEERFTAYLLRCWKQGQTASVKTPDYIRDNIPADLLARVYANFVQVAGTSPVLETVHPSGYVESQGAFAHRVAREVRARRGWPCSLELLDQTEFQEPLMRVNSELAAVMVPDWNESGFWDSLVDFYDPAPAAG